MDFRRFVEKAVEDELRWRGLDFRSLPQTVQDALRGAADQISNEHQDRLRFAGSYNALMQE